MAKERMGRTAGTPESPAIAGEIAPASSSQGEGKDAKKPGARRIKLSIWLSDEEDYRLENLSRFTRESKSGFAHRMIFQGLRRA